MKGYRTPLGMNLIRHRFKLGFMSTNHFAIHIVLLRPNGFCRVSENVRFPGEVQSDSLDQNCAPDTPDPNEPIPKVLGKGRLSPLRSDPVEVTPLSLAGKTKESEEPGNLQPAPDPNEPPVLGKGQNITIGL